MLIERELGNIPISIGTSLAFERGLYGIEEDAEVAVEDMVVTDTSTLPSEIWVNVRTLFRNLYTSLDAGTRSNYLDEKLAPDLMEEMSILSSLTEASTSGKTKIVYYHCTYASVGKIFPHAMHRVPKTPNQLAYATNEHRAIDILLKSEGVEVKVFDTKINGGDTKAFILTHQPVDLLSARYFGDLTLLESHTGKLKRRNQWNTKLSNGKKNFRLPFNSMTLQVMGDNGNLMNGMAIKIKRELLKLAEEKQWNTLTTEAKIKANLKTMKDKALGDLLLSLFYSTLR